MNQEIYDNIMQSAFIQRADILRTNREPEIVIMHPHTVSHLFSFMESSIPLYYKYKAKTRNSKLFGIKIYESYDIEENTVIIK